MGWFQKKSALPTALARAPGVPEWLRTNGSSGEFASGYEAQVEEVFRSNPIGQRAVRLVSGGVGALPVYSVKKQNAMAALVMAEGVLETIASWLLLQGNSYVQLILGAGDVPVELVVLRPDKVSLKLDGRGQPVAIDYRGGGQVTRLPLTDPLGRRMVAHLKALNPLDDHYGLGCLDAAIAPATVHNRASRWNRTLLENAARPSGALTYDPGDGSVLSAEQFARLRTELEVLFSGADVAGRPLLLDGGMKWQALSMTPADMDFARLKEGAARDIALAFGVPPVLVGLPGDATYSNAREAGRALTRQTVLPMGRRILAGLDAMLADWVGPIGLTINVDELSELAEDRLKLWEAVTNVDFLSVAEKRDMLGFEAGTGA